jgi:hypothetical protein
MTQDKLLRLFPNIDINGFKETSPINPFYNCFAWAGEDSKYNWEPSPSDEYVWLTDTYTWTIENFIANYAVIGYSETTDSAEYESGFQKIAIYADSNREPSHAARQNQDGTWTSKLGVLEDIEHRTLECVENDVYGKVAVILKKAIMEN